MLSGSVNSHGHCVIVAPSSGLWNDDPSNSTKPFRRVLCFGLSQQILRQPHDAPGRSKLPAIALELSVGADAFGVAMGTDHVAILRSDSRTVFFGQCNNNQCGLPTYHIGDDESPADWARVGP